jgi:hypothetical protein
MAGMAYVAIDTHSRMKPAALPGIAKMMMMLLAGLQRAGQGSLTIAMLLGKLAVWPLNRPPP